MLRFPRTHLRVDTRLSSEDLVLPRRPALSWRGFPDIKAQGAMAGGENSEETERFEPNLIRESKKSCFLGQGICICKRQLLHAACDHFGSTKGDMPTSDPTALGEGCTHA